MMRRSSWVKVFLALSAAFFTAAPFVSGGDYECYYYYTRRAGSVEGKSNCTGYGYGCSVCFDNQKGGQCSKNGFGFCQVHPLHQGTGP